MGFLRAISFYRVLVTFNLMRIFGTPLEFLKLDIIILVFLGLIIFGTLFFLKKKEKINLPLYLIIIIPIIVAVLLFFLIAYFFPIVVYY